MQQLAQSHVHRMAGVTEKVLPHLEAMQPDSILDRVDDIEKYDRVARQNVENSMIPDYAAPHPV
ncbi:MAG TPA: hypothetical protein VK639_03515 [Terriglobales bacterium]|nr:hypothetical protein [Terriglobales bacterium]